MNKFRIVPKRDFGAGKGFLINSKWVKSGFVVTDGLCNIIRVRNAPANAPGRACVPTFN